MLSGVAMWTFVVATMWMALEKSDLSGWVGIVAFSSMLPMLVVSPIGGLIGDTLDRKRVAVATLAGGSAVVASLALLAATGLVELWHVAVLAFGVGVCRAIQEPVMQALIPNQVPREDLLNALVLNGATRHGARFFGMLLAVPLLEAGLVQGSDLLILSAVCYALGSIQMARTRTVSSGQTRPEQSILRNILDGMLYIYNRNVIALFIILVAVHCALTMSFESILPIFSREELGATSEKVLGYLMMGFGAGSLAGLLVIGSVRSERRKGQLLMLTGLASGVTPIMLALSGNLPLAVLSAAGMGASQATFMALTNTYVQLLAPDRLRARISSLYGLHAGGIMAFANLGYGFLADEFSAPPILIMTGALFVAVMVGTGAAQPVLRRVYWSGQAVAA